MNAAEPLADAVTGGVIAGAVEPRAGGAVGTDGHTHESTCLNCGTALLGDYCHVCGQRGHVHRTLSAFGHDLLHGVLHLEGKIWRTLPKLMFNPGDLTRRYINGERARFVSPLALFLFSVFLMFAVMSFLVSPATMLSEGDRQEAGAELRAELGRVNQQIGRLQAERQRRIVQKADVTEVDQALRDAEIERSVLTALAGVDAPQREPGARVSGSVGRTTYQFEPQDGSALNQAYKAAKQNPKLLAYKLQTNAYKYSWALIIISVPFVALLFLWRRRPMYDHAVFVTYSIASVSILVITGSLLILAGVASEPVWLAALLFIPWHMYRQLRTGYELRRLSALWRTLALLIFATVALGLFGFGLLMLGVLG